jgi:hypothetical protein
MMKFPSEVMIESAISELSAHQKAAHADGEKGGKCDFCELCDELSKRNESSEPHHLCALDEMTYNVSASDPALMIITAIAGPAAIIQLTAIARAAFLIGLKSAKAMHDQQSLESLMEQ